MSTAVDLGDLGPPIYAADNGPGQTEFPLDLTNTLAGIEYQQDQGPAILAFANNLGNSLNPQISWPDKGLAYPAEPNAFTTTSLSLKTQDESDTLYLITGYDTTTSTTISWVGRSPLTPPPTEASHVIINVSCTVLAPGTAP